MRYPVMWFCLVVSVVSWVHAGSPVLVGHRGGMAGDPENSLAAFRHGRQFGRDLETDIRFTRDHVPVILHDRTLDRTTECQGLVSDYAWEQVRRCRLQTPFPCKITHHTLPTLQTVLSDRRLQTVRWILEIKAYDPVGIDRVWRMVRGKKGIAIASFDRKILHYLQVHHRAQHLYLVSRSVPRTIPSGVQGLILGACNVNQTLLKRLASRYRLFVWTVDDPAELQRVRRLPIDGIITNRLESFSRNIH